MWIVCSQFRKTCDTLEVAFPEIKRSCEQQKSAKVWQLQPEDYDEVHVAIRKWSNVDMNNNGWQNYFFTDSVLGSQLTSIQNVNTKTIIYLFLELPTFYQWISTQQFQKRNSNNFNRTRYLSRRTLFQTKEILILLNINFHLLILLPFSITPLNIYPWNHTLSRVHFFQFFDSEWCWIRHRQTSLLKFLPKFNLSSPGVNLGWVPKIINHDFWVLYGCLSVFSLASRLQNKPFKSYCRCCQNFGCFKWSSIEIQWPGKLLKKDYLFIDHRHLAEIQERKTKELLS